MTDIEERKKVLDKIAKCMRLAEDSRGDANTAAIALRQAQALIRKHAVTQEEILGYVNETVDCPIQASKKAQVPLHLSHLLWLVRSAFGVTYVIETTVRVSDASYTVRYFGSPERVAMACYAHTVLYRAADKAWKEFLGRTPSVKGVRNARTSFLVGWYSQVRNKVEEIALSENEKAGLDLYMKSHYGRDLTISKAKSSSIYDGLAAAGMKAAADFSIHRPMSGAQPKMITGS
jgi:hypothetical protein